MKSILSIFTPETILLLAIAGVFILPKTIIPFALILTGGLYLAYVLFYLRKSLFVSRAYFGPVSAAIFVLVLGICLLFMSNRFILAILTAFITMFVLQMIWVVWEARSPR